MDAAAGRARPTLDRAAHLARPFFESLSALGELLAVGADEVPPPWRELLDHRAHMTVTMERHISAEVGLRVLREARGGPDAPDDYAREILLLGPSGRVVQYGLVRIDLATLPPPVRAEIEAGRRPLGRVLIDADTMRDVHDVALFAIRPADRLRSFAGNGTKQMLYGRVASIAVASHDPSGDLPGTRSFRAVVELLEIPIP